MAQKTLLITGANKGIGFQVARTVLQQGLPYKIIVTSRNTYKGLDAIDNLHDEFNIRRNDNKIDIGLLDVTEDQSIERFMTWFNDKYGKVDTVIHNAGIATPKTASNYDILQTMFKTNYIGATNFSQQISKKLNNNGRMIYMGGYVYRDALKAMSADLKAKFNAANSIAELTQLREELFADYQSGGKVWPRFTFGPYCLSKLFLIKHAQLQAKEKDILDKNAEVFSMCPGLNATDMTGGQGQPPAKGASDVVWLMEKARTDEPKEQGGFFMKKRVKDISK